MEIVTLPVHRVFQPDGPGLPKIDIGRVEKLAASIKDIGLVNPICVRATKRHFNGALSDAWEVVAGRHRLAAMDSLGREKIPARVLADGDLLLELVTIDENLCRGVLTPAQEAAAIARRKEIYEELHPETKVGGDRGNQHTGGKVANRQNGEMPERFTAATAKAAGKSEREIQRAAHRGEELGHDALNRIVGTSLDKGTELDALAKLPESKRERLIERAAEGKQVSARAHVSQPGPDADKQLKALQAAWSKATPAVRAKFLKWTQSEAANAA